MKLFAWPAAAALALAMTAPGALADDSRFGPADPVVKDVTRLDPKRPIERELQASVPDGFDVAVVGDLIISRPLAQYAGSMPGFRAVLDRLRRSDVTIGNLETTIFDPRAFRARPTPGTATGATPRCRRRQGLAGMGFAMVARANNHRLDWGLEGMRETATGSTMPASSTPASARPTAWRARRVLRKPGPRRAGVDRLHVPADERIAAAIRAAAPGRPGLSALHVTPAGAALRRRGDGERAVPAARRPCGAGPPRDNCSA